MDLTGRTIDNYRIDKKLGEGGMGAVYMAQDLGLNKRVAIKVTHGHLADKPEFQQRFLQEAQTAAQLDHPSIVKINRFAMTQGLLYMVMEFIEGGSLGGFIKKLQGSGKVYDMRESLVVLAQAAEALGYAHRSGVIHRDIKPDNIMLKQLDQPARPNEPPLRAVITDFGLAKLLEGGINTADGAFMGTMAYMSPEQTQGKELDGRSDIYSLGVVLYQMATGRLPFDIRTPAEAVSKHMYEMPPRPEAIRTGVPAQVVQIIDRAMAKDPKQRFHTADSFAMALRTAAQSSSAIEAKSFVAAAPPVSMLTQLKSWSDVSAPERMGSQIGQTNVDQLVISQEGKPPVAHDMESQSISIGRTPDNDIQLNADGVSRRHCRIDRTSRGWGMTDVGSTNGTFLDGNKLLPNITESWEPGQVMRVGPYYIQWKSARPQQSGVTPGGRGRKPIIGGLPPAQGTYQATQGRPGPPPPGSSQIFSSTGQLGITVTPTHIDVDPGGRADMQVELFNQGITVDHFAVTVTGVPDEWVVLPTNALQLMPGAKGALPIAFQPPRTSESKAGNRSYRLTVRAASNSAESASVAGTVNVKPFEQFSAEARPTTLDHGKNSRVHIYNQGNQSAEYTILGTDPAEAVRFKGNGQQLRIEPGQEGVVNLGIEARTRPFLGRKQTLPFNIEVTSPSGVKQSQVGSLGVPPVIPPWLVSLASILSVLLCLSLVFAFNLYQNRQEEAQLAAESATQTAVAQLDQAELAAANDATATAQAQEALNAEATSLFMTAQAEGDDDGDGLSNLQESQLGTDPNLADTDLDGLNDGEEVNVHKTDPKNQDSDNDTLKDGDEVLQFKTSPNNPDTDSDGFVDSVEIAQGTDPLLPPPTVNAGATQQALIELTQQAEAHEAQTAEAIAAAAANDTTATALAEGINATGTAIAIETQNAIATTDAQNAGAATATQQAIETVNAQGTISAQETQTALDLTATAEAVPTDTPTPPILVIPTDTVTPTPSPTIGGIVGVPISVEFWESEFEVIANRIVYYIRLDEPGTITAVADWGPNQNLAMIINGPGKVGFYARADGGPGTEVEYTVTEEDFEDGDTWRISIASFGNQRLEGTVKIAYPTSPSDSFSEDFAITPTSGGVVFVLPIEIPGPLSGIAKWEGTPERMAMILNGPNQVGFYAREDAEESVELEFLIEESELTNGDYWRLSIVAFDAPRDALGKIEIVYPR